MISCRDIDLVIFDCDGVLVDSEALSNAVMAQHITRLGWPMSGDEAMQRFKGLTMAQVHQAIEDALGTVVDPDWRETFHSDQEDRMRRELQPVPGIFALITRTEEAGLKRCVASQGRHEKMQISLGTTGLLSLFEGRIFSAVDVPRPKPHPDLFLHAARQMDVKPGRCVVIEDSLTGIQGARAAGMKVIGYDANQSGALTGHGATIVSHLDRIEFT
jgi:HAD superfamily hydrolase (TIGR01509 family)